MMAELAARVDSLAVPLGLAAMSAVWAYDAYIRWRLPAHETPTAHGTAHFADRAELLRAGLLGDDGLRVGRWHGKPLRLMTDPCSPCIRYANCRSDSRKPAYILIAGRRSSAMPAWCKPLGAPKRRRPNGCRRGSAIARSRHGNNRWRARPWAGWVIITIASRSASPAGR